MRSRTPQMRASSGGTVNEPRLFARPPPPPTLLPGAVPVGSARSLRGAGNRRGLLTRGAFRRRLGAEREAREGRLMASFSGFAFQSLIHFGFFFPRVEGCGWRRAPSEASAVGRFHRALSGQPAGLRPRPAKQGCGRVCPGARESDRSPAPVLSPSVGGRGRAFRRERVLWRRPSSRPPVCAWPSPACRPHGAPAPVDGTGKGSSSSAGGRSEGGF